MVHTTSPLAAAAVELAVIYGAEDETITPAVMEAALLRCLAELREQVLLDWQWWLVSGYSPVTRLMSEALRAVQREARR